MICSATASGADHRSPNVVERTLGVLVLGVIVGALLGGAVFGGIGLFMHQSIPVILPDTAGCFAGNYDDPRCAAWALASPDDIDCGTFLQPIDVDYSADERSCARRHDTAREGALWLSIGVAVVAAIVTIVKSRGPSRNTPPGPQPASN